MQSAVASRYLDEDNDDEEVRDSVEGASDIVRVETRSHTGTIAFKYNAARVMGVDSEPQPLLPLLPLASVEISPSPASCSAIAMRSITRIELTSIDIQAVIKLGTGYKE